MEKCLNALNKVRKVFLHKKNVIGVGAGMKQVGLERTSHPSVIVFVEKKMVKSSLSRKEIIPQEIDGVPTDVIEIGRVRLLDVRTDKSRPARPGSSIGHYKITAGTFGAVVRDLKTGEPLILSNNHILANGTDGKDGRAKIGDPILQPGSYDGGAVDDKIAELLRFWPILKQEKQTDCPVAAGAAQLGSKLVHLIRPDYDIRFMRVNRGDNIIDAALARPVSRDIISPEIIDMGVPRGMSTAGVKKKVMKSGRSSGLTSGDIVAIDVSLQVDMNDAGETGNFSGQVVSDMVSKGGDSGSLIMDQEMKAVGLLFAGSEKYTVFNRLENVFAKLGVELA
ncbi:MAG: S1 family peptidase [Actinobacteria bacterium]|nr:S1 family peptidase [Actinomycetota bacterium]